jgi:hypothetical protein
VIQSTRQGVGKQIADMVRQLINGEAIEQLQVLWQPEFSPARRPESLHFLNPITNPKRFGLYPKRFGSKLKASHDRRCLMQDSILRLESATVDVVIKTHPFAEIIYWGPHLQHFSPQNAETLSRPVANGRLDVDSPVTLMAELGHGLFGSPGIEGHRLGLDGSPLWHHRRPAAGANPDDYGRR